MKVDTYLDLKQALIDEGFAAEIDWAESIRLCENADDFGREYCWVVLNSGMREQVARQIWDRVRPLLQNGQAIDSAFGHKGKRAAIVKVWANRDRYFRHWVDSDCSIDTLVAMPWIGPITKYHLAKNLGAPVVKPDRHLVRIAEEYQTTPTAMCQVIADATGDKIVVVDTVIWRAANLRMV